MRVRTQSRVVLCAFVGLITSAFVGLYAWIASALEGIELDATNGLLAGSAGLLLGVIVAGFEVFVVQGRLGRPLRRAPFGLAILIKTALAILVLCGALIVANALFFRGRYQALGATVLARDCLVLGVFFAVLFFTLQVRRIIGPRVLARFLLGRYHQPVHEERVFLFLDVSDSTRLAEQLGDTGVHALLARFFFDIAGPIQEFGGETHRYVGDEILVTWPLTQGVRDATCVRCCEAIRDRIAHEASRYEEAFGEAPKFRIGLHGGSVVLGECGDDKLQLVYFGDTINTAKRVQQSCKGLGVETLISGDLLARLELPSSLVANAHGPQTLAGRASPLELFSLDSQAAVS
jgi:adenylate cyclase